MKKRMGVIALAVCAFACCFALLGCKGGSTENAKEFIGTWNLQSVTAEAEDMKVTASDISLMQSFGYTVTLVLNGDGSAELDMFGEVSECEWTAKEQNVAVLTVDGQKVDLAIDEKGVLKMSQGGTDCVSFVKDDPNAKKNGAANAEDGSCVADTSGEVESADGGTASSSQTGEASSGSSEPADGASGSGDSSGSSSAAAEGEGDAEGAQATTGGDASSGTSGESA